MDVNDIEVLITTYNRAPFLKECLISVCNQSVSGFSITVIDNASTDNTSQIVEMFKSHNIKYYCNDSNIGWVGNFERAREIANRKWAMVFHDDDIMHPEYIENAAKVINNRNDLVLIGSFFDADATLEIDMSEKTEHGVIICETPREFASLLYGGFWYHFGSTIYRTDLLKSLRPDYDIYGKSADRPYMFEISIYGVVAVLKHPFVKWRRHEGQGTEDIFSGPYVNQWLALNTIYYKLMGSNPFKVSGRTFLYNNFGWLRWNNLFITEEASMTKIEFYNLALKSGATTRLAILCGFIRAVLSKVKRQIIKLT